MKKLSRVKAKQYTKDELYDIYLDTFKQLQEMHEKYDKSAVINVNMINKITDSKEKIEELEKEIQKLKNEKTESRNKRGAGRKQKFNDTDIETIKMYRFQGKTIKEIAEIFNCSVGLIHKLINENKSGN